MRVYRYNLFTKMIILLVVMLIPIILLYTYSNQTTTNVLGQELNQSNMNQLSFFQNQVNTNIELLSSWPNLLIHDPDVVSFNDMYLQNGYLNLDSINLVKRIQSKLAIQESSSNWRAHLSIYSPSLQRLVTDSDAASIDPAVAAQDFHSGWQVTRVPDATSSAPARFVFSWTSISPYNATVDSSDISTVIKVEFDSGNIQDMLDKFKSDGRRDPFYYNPEFGTIYNRSADHRLTDALISSMHEQSLGEVESRTVNVNHQSYMVNAVRSEVTGWYMIDYIPLNDILQPIQDSNRLFYLSVIILLLMSFIAAYLLYAQVQVPMRQLIVGFNRLKQEDYSVRITPRGRNEFAYLSDRFNSMVSQIQTLFEHVYLEKIHVREARLKQLQSQINPHFFYNCFSFITSMAKMNNQQAVIAMSQNLSQYYRYTTRQERDLVPLSEEMDFVCNYLAIQQMRMARLQYSIELEDALQSVLIPPLMIQPLVENAVIHGVERYSSAGQIRVTGRREGEYWLFSIEDDGKGMDPEAMHHLQASLEEPLGEEMGCGLWNVHQRMQLRFGEGAGVTLSPSPLGGLQVTLRWQSESGVGTV
ncbi:sensor histidine kinase [Paenibacillus wulumuqiensis]|uniref:sensor histidine kinase n=1 Tax=Paenibacillus wulumuqiensis TaxID=1567107 RepID=UPI0006991569|nr:sensor histidine kinase [Paenibacillus wulumuqiensis]